MAEAILEVTLVSLLATASADGSDVCTTSSRGATATVAASVRLRLMLYTANAPMPTTATPAPANPAMMATLEPPEADATPTVPAALDEPPDAVLVPVDMLPLFWVGGALDEGAGAPLPALPETPGDDEPELEPGAAAAEPEPVAGAGVVAPPVDLPAAGVVPAAGVAAPGEDGDEPEVEAVEADEPTQNWPDCW